MSNLFQKNVKLSISFLLIILIFIFFGMFTVKGLYTLSNYTAEIYSHPLVVSNAALHAALEMTKMHRDMKDVVLSNSIEEINSHLNDVQKSEKKVYEHLYIIKENILGKEGEQLEEQTRQLFQTGKA